ncbi:MAG TPA: YciI family protein [Polyangiaceae bacterium]
MAKYMLLLGGADLDKRSGNAALAPKMFEQFASWLSSLRERGHYLASHKLHDQTGVRLTVRGGQVVEGPFMETKEAVGGAMVIEASSLEQATALARGCPVLELQNGYVEVRLVEEVSRPATA